ncbi:MAG: pilus assembly PilX N-terminal domain-containing protein [Candidatus Gracilibacteria bacterium]|jgi:hypothetical protein|nr:pilus assembly PilX N-terminal domain-containing protein [Candidatus Gracilibacteria bacterium]
MKKNFLKFGEVKGSALLVAILIMGVFLTVSISLSTLIMREVTFTKSLLSSGKAYFAAESGIEEALYYLNTELPGYSTSSSVGKTDENSVFEYSLKNTCNSYPCYDAEDYELSNVPLENFYDVLELNETITIPLFTLSDGEIKPVKNFSVQFFPAFDPSTDLKIKSISGWDILRYKIFGMRKEGEKYITESIGDLTAFSSGSAPSGGNVFANVAKPSWFGTADCDQMGSRAGGISGISCVDYDKSIILQSEEGQVCTNTEARDFVGYVDGEVRTIYDCYSIGKFLDEHQPGVNGSTGLNYLTLTNMMNPSVFDDEKYPTIRERAALSRLYFRVETFDDEVVREEAEISSNGYSGSLKQSLKVLMRRGSYLPVFNFSVYSTYQSEEAPSF